MAIVVAEVRASLYLFHSLTWVLLLQSFQFWSPLITAQTWVSPWIMVGIAREEGRRLVFIWNELRRMDRIHRWTGRKYSSILLGLQVGQIDCHEEIGKTAWVWAVDDLNARPEILVNLCWCLMKMSWGLMWWMFGLGWRWEWIGVKLAS